MIGQKHDRVHTCVSSLKTYIVKRRKESSDFILRKILRSLSLSLTHTHAYVQQGEMESDSVMVPFPLLPVPIESNYRACTIPYRFPSDNPRKATPTEISWIDLFSNSIPSFKFPLSLFLLSFSLIFLLKVRFFDRLRVVLVQRSILYPLIDLDDSRIDWFKALYEFMI